MEFPEFVGNRRIVDFFAAHASQGSLPSGTYVFSGSPQLGKRTFAEMLCARLLKTTPERLPIHPDFLVLERFTDEKTGKRKRDITVEQSRDLKRQIATSSWGTGQRFVLIDGADMLNEEASNALLKLFEEPPARTVFFLIVQHEQALLPTIRSRAQLFYFSPVRTEEIEAALVRQNIPAPLANQHANSSWGRPGRAFMLDRSEEFCTENEGYVARLRSLLAEPFYRQSKNIEEWLGKGEEARLDRDELDATLATWTMCVRSDVNQGMHDAVTTYRVFQQIRSIEEARNLIRRQVNPRLVLEQLALRLA